MTQKHERYADLHIHTTSSDGELTVEQIISKAQAEGLSAIALTDHNCFAIQSPIVKDDLEVIPGAEFSSIYEHDEGAKTETHVVGLFFDGVSTEMEDVVNKIDTYAYERAIVLNLNALGLDITLQEVIDRNHVCRQCNRYQIADVLIDKGYATDRDNAMDLWIGNYSPHYINPAEHVKYMSMAECVSKISKCGIPVLAHPYHYHFTEEQIEKMVSYFRSLSDGPMAIEVYYRNYNEDQIRFLESLADKYNLLRSGGSDRHKKDQKFTRMDGCWFDKLKAASGK